MTTMFVTSALIVGLFYVFLDHSEYYSSHKFGSLTHTNIMKGLAIFLVVINHFGAKSGYRYFQPLGGIGVSLFLICSGYGLMKSFHNQGFDHYVRKRVLKTLIPYWIIFIAYSFMSGNGHDLFGLVSGLLLLQVPGIFWFIQYIALFYLAFYITYTLAKGPTRIFVLLLFSGVVFCVNPTLLLGEQAFAFVFGVWLTQVNGEVPKRELALIGSILILVGVLSLVLKQTSFIRESHFLLLNFNGVLIKTGTALGLFLVMPLLMRFSVFKVFLVGSNYSLEIYLVHVVLIEVMLVDFSLANLLTIFTLSLIGIIVLRSLTRKLAELIATRSFTNQWLNSEYQERDEAIT